MSTAAADGASRLLVAARQRDICRLSAHVVSLLLFTYIHLLPLLLLLPLLQLHHQTGPLPGSRSLVYMVPTSTLSRGMRSPTSPARSPSSVVLTPGAGLRLCARQQVYKTRALYR